MWDIWFENANIINRTVVGPFQLLQNPSIVFKYAHIMKKKFFTGNGGKKNSSTEFWSSISSIKQKCSFCCYVTITQ